MASSPLCCKHSWHCYRAPRHLARRCRDASGEAMRNLTFSGKDKTWKEGTNIGGFWKDTLQWLVVQPYCHCRLARDARFFLTIPTKGESLIPLTFSWCTESRSEKETRTYDLKTPSRELKPSSKQDLLSWWFSSFRQVDIYMLEGKPYNYNVPTWPCQRCSCKVASNVKAHDHCNAFLSGSKKRLRIDGKRSTCWRAVAWNQGFRHDRRGMDIGLKFNKTTLDEQTSYYGITELEWHVEWYWNKIQQVIFHGLLDWPKNPIANIIVALNKQTTKINEVVYNEGIDYAICTPPPTFTWFTNMTTCANIFR